MLDVPRRSFCKIVGVAGIAAATEVFAADETIVRSGSALSIGIHPKTGVAFVEEKGSGEKWVWNWHDVGAADLRSFDGAASALRPVTPKSITPDPAGFRLRYEEPWGRFDCVVELGGSEVVFRVEPDVRYPCDLGAIRFPPALRPESEGRPIFLDTTNAGRMHKASSSVVRPK